MAFPSGLLAVLLRLVGFLLLCGISLSTMSAQHRRFATWSSLLTMFCKHLGGQSAPRSWLLSFWLAFLLSPALQLEFAPGQRSVASWVWSMLFVVSTWRISFALDPICWPERSDIPSLPARPTGPAGAGRVAAATLALRLAADLWLSDDGSRWGQQYLAGIQSLVVLLVALATMLRIAAPVSRQKDAARFIIRHPLMFAVASTVAWLGSGTAVYIFINEWTLAQAFYYTVQGGLSIGFGLLEEESPLSKAFTIAHVLIGAGAIAGALALFTEMAITNHSEERRRHSGGGGGRGPAPRPHQPGWRQRRRYSVCHFVSSAWDHLSASSELLVVWLAAGCVFGCLYEKWSLIDSLYFSVTALSTGGLKAPSNDPVSLWFTGIFSLTGVPIFAAALGETANVLIERVHRVRLEANLISIQNQIRSHRLRQAVKHSLVGGGSGDGEDGEYGDGDGEDYDESDDEITTTPRSSEDSEDGQDGVEWDTFLQRCLMSIGAVDGKTLELIRAHFDELDTNGDGIIDSHDDVATAVGHFQHAHDVAGHDSRARRRDRDL